MNSLNDAALAALLKQQWQAPMARPLAIDRLLSGARAAPQQVHRQWRRWVLPSAALAATLLLGFWSALPLLQVRIISEVTSPQAATASLTEDDMMSYIFATYQLEETL